MTLRRRKHRNSAAGQALVLMLGAMVAVVGMLGLIIDGGNAWANQRMVQQGSDAAAESGAVILAQRLAGATAPGPGWDTTVRSAVFANAAANGITVAGAYYTDICGIPLRSDGSAALNMDHTYDLAHADALGTGLPAVITTTPDCPNRTVGPVAGVLVLGQQDIRTYFASLFGISTFSINTQSTAAAGYLQSGCAASEGEACAALPIIFPVDITSCSGTNDAVDTGVPWSADGTTVYIVPLCKDSPGNVGWIDWNGSNSKQHVLDSILIPNNPAVTLPSWQNVAVPGNPNMAAIENAVNAYSGQIVLVPQFDLTCNPGPNGKLSTVGAPEINTGPLYGCPSAADLGGNGTNQWYRIPSFAHFKLCTATDAACAAKGATQGAYINGNNRICDTGNGATSCLIGKFVSIVSTGTIGPGVGGGTGTSKAVSVQLLK